MEGQEKYIEFALKLGTSPVTEVKSSNMYVVGLEKQLTVRKTNDKKKQNI